MNQPPPATDAEILQILITEHNNLQSIRSATVFEANGLSIVAQKRVWMSRAHAKEFYKVHAARPFYNDLVDFMCSGPVVVQVLEGENAVAANRAVMGATNPEKAAAGTIRKEFAANIERNAVHGSDAPETAREEIAFFFSTADLAALAR